jgi:hypothetical protein
MKNSSKTNHIVACRCCHQKNSMHLLYDFGDLPVAGYLEDDLQHALEAPRFNNSIAICISCGLVQQANDDSKGFLIDKVYQNYQPTYSMSSKVRIYLESFLDKAVSKSQIALKDKVIEIGSNDGGFLEILKKRGYGPVGFDPSARSDNRSDGSEIIVKDFFGVEAAKKYVSEFGPVKLVTSRHTLEHVFDPIDFLNGLEIVLDKDGIAVIEVPYLSKQMMNNQFQSMTYQHITFFTVRSMRNLLKNSGLNIYDIEFSPMDAGAMIVYVKKTNKKTVDKIHLDQILSYEKIFELDSPKGYKPFFQKFAVQRNYVQDHFNDLKLKGHKIFAYGAGGKGQAILNILKLDADIIPNIIDDTPEYKGQFVPGTGNCVINSGDSKLEKDDITIFITAPSHINEIMTNELERKRLGVQYFVSVPEFHYIN